MTTTQKLDLPRRAALRTALLQRQETLLASMRVSSVRVVSRVERREPVSRSWRGVSIVLMARLSRRSWPHPFAPSATCSHARQRSACGRTSSRASGMSAPQSMQTP